LVRARPGQRIALKAFDFGGGEQIGGGSASSSSSADEDLNGRIPYRDHHPDDEWSAGDFPSSSSYDAASVVDLCPVIASFEEPSTESGAVSMHGGGRRGGTLRLCDVDQQRGTSGSSAPVYVSAGNQLAIRFVTRNDSSTVTSTAEHRLFLSYEGEGVRDSVSGHAIGELLEDPAA
jgi:hypothetical protein